MLASAAKLWFEAGDRRDGDEAGREPLQQSARLLRGPLTRTEDLRWVLGVAGGVILPALAILALGSGEIGVAGASAVLSLAVSIGGESVERYLFFRAVTRHTMPGGLPS